MQANACNFFVFICIHINCKQVLVYQMFLPALPMSKLTLLLTGLAFAYKQLLVFMHTAQ